MGRERPGGESRGLWRRRAAALLALSAAAALAGCAPSHVATTQAYAGPQLPRPDRVLVYDFAVAPDQVTLDRGVGARLLRAFQGTPQADQQRAAGAKVAEAVAQKLVAEIEKLGLPAERAGGAAGSAEVSRLLIQGDILSIDEGNRTRRVMIGLGAGASEVEAETQVLYAAPGGPARLVQSYTAEAESSRKPGMAETMGAGAAADRLATSAAVGGVVNTASETYGSDVEAVAARMAQQIAKNLATFFVSQGWIAPARAQ
ncbi:MAG TPA: DUF4410 domain-containing protein [Alphaproteobacteria bacterium]|nr:DUF4410 domain-containing protein [Alphaproteobacteria bacterium]